MKLEAWNKKQDAMRLQRSRINWYQAGDRNTGFFHAKALARNLKNHIEGLLDENDCWHEDEEKIGEMAVNYYEKLFSTTHPTEFSELLQALQPKVIVEINRMLGKLFTEDEARRATKQMYPLKALGPDRMPPLFYQHFWPNIG